MISEPTFHLLDSRVGWRTRLSPYWGRQVAAGGSLCLTADPNGPLALTSPDGSLGRLTLPRGTALDERGRLYVIGSGARLRRTVTDCAAPDTPLQVVELETLGGRAVGERRFGAYAGMAIVAERLYIANRATGRVIVFDLSNLALLDTWQFPRGQVLDVYGQEDRAYVLAGSTVYCHDTVVLQPLFSDSSQAWRRILVDAAGRIYLYDLTHTGKRISVFKSRASRRDPSVRLYDVDERFDDANALRDRFPAPLVQQEQRGDGEVLLVLPGGMMTRDGKILQPDPLEPMVSAERLYTRQGVYIVALDSKLPYCAWDRVELEMESLPPGTVVRVKTHSADDPDGLSSEAAGYVDVQDYWADALTLTAPVQTLSPLVAQTENGLISSRAARAQALWIELSGDGYETPRIRALRVHFPRDSYLKHLPSVFSSENESRHFLERLLAVFQISWNALEREIERIPRYYDPASVPGGAAMEYLARWLDLPLPLYWTAEQKRRVLKVLPKILGQRGRRDGLRDLLRAYLAGISGVETEQICGYPVLIEGFMERQHTQLNGEGNGQAMWGDDVMRRLQLDVFSTEGEVELLSYGDARLDPFERYAHSFRVVVPAALMREERDEILLRQILDAEKPAHTHYELHFVPSHFRVGAQALLGIDTIVGAMPTHTALEGGRSGSQLGYDSVLNSQTTRR